MAEKFFKVSVNTNPNKLAGAQPGMFFR